MPAATYNSLPCQGEWTCGRWDRVCHPLELSPPLSLHKKLPWDFTSLRYMQHYPTIIPAAVSYPLSNSCTFHTPPLISSVQDQIKFDTALFHNVYSRKKKNQIHTEQDDPASIMFQQCPKSQSQKRFFSNLVVFWLLFLSVFWWPNRQMAKVVRIITAIADTCTPSFKFKMVNTIQNLTHYFYLFTFNTWL